MNAATHCCQRDCPNRVSDLPPLIVTDDRFGEVPSFFCAEHRAEALTADNVREMETRHGSH